MAKFYCVQGTTSQIVHLFALNSSATDGSALTGISFSAAGLQMAYIRPGDSAHTTVALTGSGLNLGTYVSGAWLEVNAGTMPGVYEFHVPNAAVTTGFSRVVFLAKGAASMAPIPFEIQMDNSNSLFTPILSATTHAGATIPIVNTVSRVLLADTVSTVSRALLVDTVSTVARALLVDTATVVLNVNTATTVINSVTVGTYSAGQSPAAFILSTTANKLLTDASGFVTVKAGTVNDVLNGVVVASGTINTVINSVTVGTYAANMAPNTQILSTTANKLITDGSGFVTVGTNNDKSGYSLASGQLAIKKNATYPNFMFLMTDTGSHKPMTGLSVTGQYSITGAAFGPMASVASEMAAGWYKIDLAAAELNGPISAIRLTAAGADDRCFTLFPQV